MWVAHSYPFEKKRRFITSGGLGTMGFGLGAAIGIQVAHPDKNVVLITGDGGFLMNCNELATVKKENLPIVTVVVNNKQLGMVKSMMKSSHGNKITAIKKSPGFASVARAFKIKGYTIKNGKDFAEYAEEVRQKRIPAVFDLIRRYK
jgi:acetolactate synthase-1/2/3 large subunit